MKRVLGAVIVIVSSLFMLPQLPANAEGSLKMVSGNSGNFYWNYPDVCEYFNRTINDGSVYQVTLTVACPAGYGFSSFDLYYGSGSGSKTFDNISQHVKIRGQRGEFTTIVQAIPGPDVWVNLKIYPDS